MSEQQESPQQTRYEIVFTASGVVGRGEGPDALPTPSEIEDEA